MLNRNNNLLFGVIIFVFFALFFVVEDRENLLSALFSLSITIISFKSISTSGLKTYNVFLLFYFAALFTSTFQLSDLQTDTTIYDFYYYFFGPVIFSIVLYFFENRKNTVVYNKIEVIDVNKLYVIFLVIYLAVKIYIGFKLGWRIDSLKFGNTYLKSGSEYVIPGVSGFVAIIQWMLLIFAPYVKRKYVIVAILAIIVLSGILHVKRGDIIRVTMFLIIWFIANQLKNKSFSIKKRAKTIFILIFAFLLFVELGNIRQEARGTGQSNLKSDIGMVDSPISIAWFYGYISINFEVLKHYFQLAPTNSPNSIISLVSQIEDDSEDSRLGYNINGFNASTFISGFIKDFGEYYFLEMLVFGIIIGILIIYINKFNFFGCYIFLLSILSMSFFGNYLSSRSIFLGIVLSIIIYPYLKIKKRINI